MATTIHSTAVIDRSADLAEGVEIGAYAVVGANVRIGAGTHIHTHAVVVAQTVIGENCTIHPQAIIGAEPQDLKYKGESTQLVIGNHNIIRECVTINRGTGLGGGKTIIGDRNLIMAYAHIAHDCVIGNECVLTNSVQLAGHIIIEDMAIISGLTGVHHFCTIGTQSFVAGLSAVRTDVPPYMIVEGNPARVRKLNEEGLRRRGISDESRRILRQVFKKVYRSDMNRAEAIEAVEADPTLFADPTVKNLIAHYRASEAGFQGRALEAFRKDKGDTRQLAKSVPENSAG